MDTDCGVERWAVKTLSDVDTTTIDFSKIDTSSIRAEYAWTKPTSPSARLDLEKHVVSITAHLVSYVKEDDGDIHLVLQDDSGLTMIGEIPSPTCASVIHTSHVDEYSTAVQWIKTNVGNPTTSFKDAERIVTVTGVRFFDFIHNQRGVADNGVEIHPVLSIR
ncbi:MAG: hypothetical protein JSS75_05930 [Bacteroidetes bacterium]|nr:hypothetical protein [Bacteroidota bacterium]